MDKFNILVLSYTIITTLLLLALVYHAYWDTIRTEIVYQYRLFCWRFGKAWAAVKTWWSKLVYRTKRLPSDSVWGLALLFAALSENLRKISFKLEPRRTRWQDRNTTSNLPDTR